MFGPRKKSKTTHQSGSKESVSSTSGSSGETIQLKDMKDGVEKFLQKKVSFDVHLLGYVQNINMVNSRTRDKEAQLIDHLEEAQIEGKLPLSVTEDMKVKINLSVHGLKVIDSDTQGVLHRHPLHTIAQVIQYDDAFRKPNVAVKIGQVTKTVFQCFVFQCQSEDQAQKICQTFKGIFDAITHKTT